MICELAENGRSNPSHAKSEAKEKAGNESYFTGKQFLSINQDSRKRRGQDYSDQDAKHDRPTKIGVGQYQREWCDAQDRYPDNIFASEAVTNRPADDGSSSD